MWLLHIASFLIPSVIGAAAIALFLTRRSLAPRTVWLAGFSIVTAFVVGITWALYRSFQGQAPVRSLLMSFATLYYLPFVVLTSAAWALRTRLRSRAVGVVVLFVLFLAVGVAASYASGYFFDVVIAEG